MALIAELVPSGTKRDMLMVRPFTVGLIQQFAHGILRQPEEVQRHKMELAAPLMKQYWTRSVAERIKVGERLRLECVALGRLDLLAEMLEFVRAGTKPVLVHQRRAGKLYLAYPYFRSREAGIPDASYQVTVDDWVGRPGEQRVRAPKLVRRRSPARRIARVLLARLRRPAATT